MQPNRDVRRSGRAFRAGLAALLMAATAAEPGLAFAPADRNAPSARAAAERPSGAGGTTSPGAAAGAPTLAQLVGQKLMVRISGTTPSADLLGRVRRGEIGGVILFGFNIASADGLRALTRQLRLAAAEGGQPPLLIATDQEGGGVNRVAWAPPTLSAREMGDLGSASTAEAQGLATGHVLRCAGINTNLAPVADVPASPASFMYEAGRTWSFDAALTAALSSAFATGLATGGNVAVMKHFPGIGFATDNTDDNDVTIAASAAQLAPGLLPYETAIADGLPMIMLSNATYTAYDDSNAAGWSRAIVEDLLRDDLGFEGVTITDSLSGTAAARGVTSRSLARKAAKAGTDMIMLTGRETGTAAAYAQLLEDAQNGRIPLAALQASYARIVALKATLAGPVADSAPPTIEAPVSRLYAPSTLGSAVVPVRTSWSASDPCAISGYDLARRVDGSAWVDQAIATPTSTSIKRPLVVGSTYRYAVAAADGAGNASDAAKGPFFEPILRQSSRSNVTFSGGWTRTVADGFSGGATWHASTAGATATHTFVGSSVGWVAAVGPGRGSADVYVDGELRRTVSLHAASPATRQIVFVASWPNEGSHTIEIVVVGTPGHPRIDVDAFVRLQRP